MNLHSSILVTGHRGLVGSAVVHLLKTAGYTGVVTIPRSEVDLTNAADTKWFFSACRPEYVFHCAARVGGVKDNHDHQLSFLLENLDIQRNVLLNAADYGVTKLLFLGSSCVYPKACVQPIETKSLLTGPFEESVAGYGLAKVAGIRMCQWLRKERGLDAVSVMPCNLFGQGADFDPARAHVIPGLMGRMYEAKLLDQPTFAVWGDGTARREFLYVHDLARALLTIMDHYSDPEPINAGSGEETRISDLARMIASVVGYDGEIVFDPEQVTGVSRKVMDSSVLRGLGWKPEVSLRSGLRLTYEWFAQKKREVAQDALNPVDHE